MNCVLTLSLSLKHTTSADLGSPVWNSSTSGNCLEAPQLSPSLRHAPSSTDQAHAAGRAMKNDWEFEVDESVRLLLIIQTGLIRDSRVRRNLRSIG
jgi:hypothetical protein